MAGQPLNATFFAFRKREKGGVLLGASVAFLVTVVLFLVVFGAAVWAMLGGSDFTQWYRDTVSAGASGGAATAPPNMGGLLLIFPAEMLFLFGFFVLFAAYESACLRWMIRGERSGALNLNFGADMWRVYGTYWAWLLFFIVSVVLFWIVMLVVGLVAGAAGRDNPVVAAGVVGIACIVWILAWIHTAVRLSPAAATSVGTATFAPMKAWSVSRGRFWGLFGSYFLLFVLYVIVFAVLGAIFFGAFYGAIFSQLDWSQATSDPVAFNQAYQQAVLQAMQNQFANPVAIALYIAGQLVSYAVAVVFYVLFFGVNARAVVAAAEDGKIEGVPNASVANTFE